MYEPKRITDLDLQVLELAMTGQGLRRKKPGYPWRSAEHPNVVISPKRTINVHRLVRMGFLRVEAGSLRGLTGVELHPDFLQVRFEWDVLRAANILVPPRRMMRWSQERMNANLVRADYRQSVG